MFVCAKQAFAGILILLHTSQTSIVAVSRRQDENVTYCPSHYIVAALSESSKRKCLDGFYTMLASFKGAVMARYVCPSKVMEMSLTRND